MPAFHLLNSHQHQIDDEQTACALLKFFDSFVQEIVEPYHFACLESINRSKSNHNYEFVNHSNESLPTLDSFFNEGFTVRVKKQGVNKSISETKSIENFSILPIFKISHKTKLLITLTVQEIIPYLSITTFNLALEDKSIIEILENKIREFFIEQNIQDSIEEEDENHGLNRKDFICFFIKTLAYFCDEEVTHFLIQEWLPKLLMKYAINSFSQEIAAEEIEDSADMVQYINEFYLSETNGLANEMATDELVSHFIDYLTINPGFMQYLHKKQGFEITIKFIKAATTSSAQGTLLTNETLQLEHQTKLIDALLKSLMKTEKDSNPIITIFIELFGEQKKDGIVLDTDNFINRILDFELDVDSPFETVDSKTNDFLLSLIHQLPKPQFDKLITIYTLKLTKEDRLKPENRSKRIQKNLAYIYSNGENDNEFPNNLLASLSTSLAAIYLLNHSFSLDSPMELKNSVINLGANLQGLKALFSAVESFSEEPLNSSANEKGYKKWLFNQLFMENENFNFDSIFKPNDKFYDLHLLQEFFSAFSLDLELSELFATLITEQLDIVFLTEENSENEEIIYGENYSIENYINTSKHICGELIDLVLTTPFNLSKVFMQKLNEKNKEFSSKILYHTKNYFVTFCLEYLIKKIFAVESNNLIIINESNFINLLLSLVAYNYKNKNIDKELPSYNNPVCIEKPLYNIYSDEINVLLKLLNKITEDQLNLANEKKRYQEKNNQQKIVKIEKAIGYLKQIYKILYQNHYAIIEKLLKDFITNPSLIAEKDIINLIDTLTYNLPLYGLRLRFILNYHVPFSKRESILITENPKAFLNYLLMPTFIQGQRKELISFIFEDNQLTPIGLALFYYAQLAIEENQFLKSDYLFFNNADQSNDQYLQYLAIKNNIKYLYQAFTEQQRGQFFQSLLQYYFEINNQNITWDNREININLIEKNFIFLLNQATSINNYPIFIYDEKISDLNKLLMLLIQSFPRYLPIIFNKMMATGKIAEQEITVNHVIQAFIADEENFVRNINTLQTILNKFESKIEEQDALIILALTNHLLLQIIKSPQANSTNSVKAANEIRQKLLEKSVNIPNLLKQIEKNNLVNIINKRLEKPIFYLKDKNLCSILSLSQDNFASTLDTFCNQLTLYYFKKNQSVATTYLDINHRLGLLVNEAFTELSDFQQNKLINTLVHHDSLLIDDLNKLFHHSGSLSNNVADTIVRKNHSLLFTKENFAKLENTTAKAMLFLAGYNNLHVISPNQQLKQFLYTLAQQEPNIITTLFRLPLSQNKRNLLNYEQIENLSRSNLVHYLVQPEPKIATYTEDLSGDTSFMHKARFLSNRKRTKAFRNLLIEGDLQDSIAKNIIAELAKNNCLLMSDIISIFIERAMLNKPLSKSLAKNLMKYVMTGENTEKNWLQFANFSYYLEINEFTKIYKNHLFQAQINKYDKLTEGKTILATCRDPLAKQKAFINLLYEKEINHNPDLIQQLTAELDNDYTIENDNIFDDINNRKNKSDEVKQALVEHYLNHRMLDVFSEAKETIFLTAHEVEREKLKVRLGINSNRVAIHHLTKEDYLKINHGKVMNKKEQYITLSGEEIKESLEKKATEQAERFIPNNEKESNLFITNSGYFIKGNNFAQKKQSLAKGFQHWRAKTIDGSKFKTLTMRYETEDLPRHSLDNTKKLTLDLNRGQEELPKVGIKFYQLHRYIALIIRKIFNAIAKKFASKPKPEDPENLSLWDSLDQDLIDWGKNNQSPCFTMADKVEPLEVQYHYAKSVKKQSSPVDEQQSFSPFFVSQEKHDTYIAKRIKAGSKEAKKQIFNKARALQSQVLPNIH